MVNLCEHTPRVKDGYDAKIALVGRGEGAVFGEIGQNNRVEILDATLN